MINLKFVTNTLLFAEWWEKPYFVAPPHSLLSGNNFEFLAHWRSTPQFVAHPNVQQLLASIWYEGLPGFRQKNMILQVTKKVVMSVLSMTKMVTMSELIVPKILTKMIVTKIVVMSVLIMWQCSGYRGVPDRADVPDLLNLVHSLPVDFLLTGILSYSSLTSILVIPSSTTWSSWSTSWSSSLSFWFSPIHSSQWWSYALLKFICNSIILILTLVIIILRTLVIIILFFIIALILCRRWESPSWSSSATPPPTSSSSSSSSSSHRGSRTSWGEQ